MRRSQPFVLAVIAAFAMLACGPSSGGDDDDDDGGGGGDGGIDVCSGDQCGTLEGTVWAPGMAPGMVPAGQEIPIFGALVYLSLTRPAPIPQEVYCERCVNSPGGVTTDHDGNFSLGSLRPGTYWLVIQKGQFRLEQQVTVAVGTTSLPDADTVLPSQLDVANGKTIPRIAMVVGSYDSLEDILGKMGLGSVDGTGSMASTMGEIDVYPNGGTVPADSTAMGTLAQLVADLNRLRSYHIIFVPCASSGNVAALQVQQNLRNLRQYGEMGRKLYVTDWSGEWMDNVFPAQITLGDSGTDTPASAYNAAADTWNTAQFGDADGSFYNSPDGEAANLDLRTWLDGQAGPRGESGDDVGPFNPIDFDVYDNWNWIRALTPQVVGQTSEGMDIVDTPEAWVIGSGSSGGGAGKKPLTVTFNPPGCGRVLFSTYHTTPTAHLGLIPQERVLLYLIMEIGVCNSNPPIG